MNICKKFDVSASSAPTEGGVLTPRGMFLTACTAMCWIVFICLQISGMIVTVAYSYIGFIVGWFPMITIVFLLRVEAREKWGIYGNYAEDFFAAMIMWPMVLSQIELHVSAVPKKEKLAYGPAKGVELDIVENQLGQL